MQLPFRAKRVTPSCVERPFELRDVFGRLRRQLMGFGFGFSHGDAVGSRTRKIAGASVSGQSGRSSNNAEQVRTRFNTILL